MRFTAHDEHDQAAAALQPPVARLIDEDDLAPFVQALGQGGRPFASSASLPHEVLPVTQGRRLVLGVHMLGG